MDKNETLLSLTDQLYNFNNLTPTVNNYINQDTCFLYKNIDEDDSMQHVAMPNRALISLLSLIGTCVIALALKKLRRSVFFGSYVRKI